MIDLPEGLKTRTWPWMTGAVVLVAGFMFWLHAASSDIDDGTDLAADTAAVPSVADSIFAAAPGRFSGRRIQLPAVNVGEQLGRASFTLNLPGSPSYPAILERALLEQDVRVVAGDRLDLAGWVYALNDSIIGVWAQRGIFNPENRGKLQDDSTFFLVDSLDFVFPGDTAAAAGGA